MPSKWTDKFPRLAFLAASILALLTLLAGYLGKLHWILDLFSHFRMYNLGGLVLLAIIGSILRERKIALLLIGAALLSGTSILPCYQSPKINCADSTPIKLVAINLLSENKQHQKVEAFTRSEDPDLLILMEYTQEWHEGLKKIRSDFSFEKHEIRDDNFGLAVYSRLPIDSVETLRISGHDVPTYLLSLVHQKTPLNIVATHAIPPFYPTLFRVRQEQFRQIGDILRKRPGEDIVMGDFNCSGFSPNFPEFLADGHLRDSRLGFGIQPSWFARTSLIAVDLDHALVSSGLGVLNRRTGPKVGSDHLPIILEVCIED